MVGKRRWGGIVFMDMGRLGDWEEVGGRSAAGTTYDFEILPTPPLPPGR